MSKVNVGLKRYILLFLCTALSIQAADSANSWYSNWYNGLINLFSPRSIKKEHVAASALALGAAASMCYLYNRYNSEPISQRVLRIINSLDPALYAAIIKVDPTGKEHIQSDNIRYLGNTVSVQDGLPIIAFGTNVQKLSDDQLRAIIAHELGHYVSGHHIIGERKFTHPTLKRAYSRIQEYEADRSEILDFGIDVAAAIAAAEIIQAEEQEEQLKNPRKVTFTRYHPLWSHRIDHFKALGQEVELRKARREPRQQINWQEHAKAYLELIEEYKKSLKKK